MGVITHESGHAALAWCREAKVDPCEMKLTDHDVSHGEEIFCWVLGNIARQIVLKAHEQWPVPSVRTAKGGYAY